ncbi:MAG: cell division protein FtsA [Solirubrobacterales bacterium]
MDNSIFALDIGTRSIIGTVGAVRDKKFNVIAESMLEHEERAMKDGQIHDINLVAATIKKVIADIEKQIGIRPEKVSIAAAGRFLKTVTVRAELKIDSDREIDKDIIRSLELTALKNAENLINESSVGDLYCVGYSVKNFYLNGYSISSLLSHKGEQIEAEIIATFLPRSVVNSLYTVMDIVGLQVINLTLEPIAAMEAAIPNNLRLLNLALIDIGAGTSDIAISSKDTICAYGMVPLAGDEITEAIAQNYVVDFNTAESMKKQCSIKDTVEYTDILGFQNSIPSSELIDYIEPQVKMIADEVCLKIKELNGDKSPSAVFLVGGGAYTPKLREFVALNLNIPINRVGIRGRDEVQECICQDNSLGSIGVTVLGIALNAIKNSGNDFMDVVLNGNVVSLFNSHKNTVMDAMVQGGINPKVLIGRNGKNKKFYVNGIKRVAFGLFSENAVVTINGHEASIDSEVKEGDNIVIHYAKDGKDAEPKIKDFVVNFNSVSFYLNGEIKYLEPICSINGIKAEMDSQINEEDSVTIIYPETLRDYITNIEEEIQGAEYFIGDKPISYDYTIKEGDLIDSISKETEDVSSKPFIIIKFNGMELILSGKEEYVFVDVFNYTDFDLMIPKGKLVLLLNGNPAGYYDKIQAGDDIQVYWQN